MRPFARRRPARGTIGELFDIAELLGKHLGQRPALGIVTNGAAPACLQPMH